MTIQKPDLPQIKQDLYGVETRRRQFTEIEKKLNDYTATVDEAIEWYYSQDPLKEQRMLDVLLSTKDRSFARLLMSDIDAQAQSQFYDRAAAILIGNLTHPQIIGSENVEESGLSTVINTVNNVTDIPLLMEGLEQIQLDKRGITQLAIAGDMLIEASDFVSYSGLTISYPTAIDEVSKHGLLHFDKSSEINKMYLHTGNRAYLIAAYNAYEKAVGLDGHELEQDPKMSELWMKMLVRASAILFNDRQDKKKAIKETIEPLLGSFVEVLENDSMDGIDASVLKGDWHEFSWFVDFCMNCQTNGYSAFIRPSAAFEDCPHSNYPKYNRGFDYRVENVHIERAVQLKSSPKAAKKSESHPLIITAVEADFSAEPAELIDKFECYRKYINSNFDPRLRPEVESHILPSVKTVCDKISQIEDLSDRSTLHHINQIHDIGLELPFYNRAMRRARDNRQKR